MRTWRELDFFRPHGGLSPNVHSLECAIAYDVELVRECQPLVESILRSPDRAQKAEAWVNNYPYLSRWSPNLAPGFVDHPEREPRIPTACLLTPWFPAPWLSGSKENRRRIVKQLSRAYAVVRPLILRPYPLEPDFEKVLKIAQGDDHLYAVLSFNRKERFSRLVAQFKETLLKLGIRPEDKESRILRRYIGSVHALERLCCYRLAQLSTKDRDLAAEGINHLRNGVSRSKLSKAKKAVMQDFTARNYNLLLFSNSL